MQAFSLKCYNYNGKEKIILLFPKNEIIFMDLKEKILNKPNKVNQIIDSERNLAIKYHVSRNTIRQAINNLLVDGVILKDGKTYIFNSKKIDFITSSIKGIPTPNLEFHNLSLLQMEANKTQAEHLNVLIGQEITIGNYVVNQKEEKNYFSKVYLELPVTISNFYSVKESLLDYSLKVLKAKVIKEEQHISLQKDSNFNSKSSDVAQPILKRESKFFLNNGQGIFLISKTLIPFAKISTPDLTIQKKVGDSID